MPKRTIREFPVTSNLWADVESWAREVGFEAIETMAERRLYRRGREHMDYPIMVAISIARGLVHLEAWVKASTFDRSRALFLIPAEIGIESGGPQMIMARNTGRKLVNTLLARLSQQPIS